MKPLEDDAKNFYETIVKKQRSLFLTSEQYEQFAVHPRCEFLHLKDFPSPFREQVAKFHDHDLRYGNILDVMQLIIHAKIGYKCFMRYLLSDKHKKYLDLIDKPAPKSENTKS